MSNLIRKNLLLILIILFTISCYIAPDSEKSDGSIAFNIPLSSLTAKSVPYGTAGFEVIVAGGTVSDPYNITAEDELVFYYKDIFLSENVLTESGGEEYTITLDEVPEGDNLVMIIKYKADNVSYNDTYGMEVGTIGYFVTETPFSVKSGETTYITLTAAVYYSDIPQ